VRQGERHRERTNAHRHRRSNTLAGGCDTTSA
jgi:hypothetical protein